VHRESEEELHKARELLNKKKEEDVEAFRRDKEKEYEEVGVHVRLAWFTDELFICRH